MSLSVVRPAVALAFLACALVGHLWMHAEPALPDSVHAAMAAAADVEEGHDAEDGHRHVMALACMAILGGAAAVVRRRITAAPVLASSGHALVERTSGWNRCESRPLQLDPGRVSAGITLLI